MVKQLAIGGAILLGGAGIGVAPIISTSVTCNGYYSGPTYDAPLVANAVVEPQGVTPVATSTPLTVVHVTGTSYGANCTDVGGNSYPVSLTQAQYAVQLQQGAPVLQTSVMTSVVQNI